MNTKLLKLAKLVLKFQQVTVGDKEWIYSADELTEGVEVYVDVNGEFVPVEDGSYIVDNKTIVIKDGKVESVAEIVEEVTELEDDIVDETIETVEEDEKDLKIKELEALLVEKDAEIESLNQKIKELENQAEAPKEEAVNMNKQFSISRNQSGAIKFFE